MFKRFNTQKITLDKIETVIGANTSFEGHLKCDGNVRIDGLCEGGIIETVGNVVVSPQARVAAKIIAEHVSVAGEVTGVILARGHLEILNTGRVHGDVRVGNFYKDEMGVLSGRLVMGDENTEAAEPNEAQGSLPALQAGETEDDNTSAASTSEASSDPEEDKPA